MVWTFILVIGIPIIIFALHGYMRGNATKKVQQEAYAFGWKFNGTEEAGRHVDYIYTRKSHRVIQKGKNNRLIFRDEEFRSFSEIEDILEAERKERRRK